MPAIYLYAELLLHIRQVAVLAILPTPVDATTHIGISADSRTLSLEHGGVRAIAELPCPVLGIANRREDTSQTELSFRLQPSGAARLPTPVKGTFGDTPWPATSLAANTQIACKGCKKLLARPISNFKDLPSGGWAEMMELWHCHKPNSASTPASGDDSSSSSTKGYSASNVVGPSPGTALVDVSHFVLADEDCIGIQVRSSSSSSASPLAPSSGAASIVRPSSTRSAPPLSNSISTAGGAGKPGAGAPIFRATSLASLRQYHEYLQQLKAQKDEGEDRSSQNSRSDSASVQTSVCADPITNLGLVTDAAIAQKHLCHPLLLLLADCVFLEILHITLFFPIQNEYLSPSAEHSVSINYYTIFVPVCCCPLENDVLCLQ